MFLSNIDSITSLTSKYLIYKQINLSIDILNANSDLCPVFISRWGFHGLMRGRTVTSVTRFGEISPLCPRFKKHLQFLNIFLALCIIPNFWQFFLSFWANFNCCKWPSFEQIIQPSGHTDGNHLTISISIKCHHFKVLWPIL